MNCNVNVSFVVRYPCTRPCLVCLCCKRRARVTALDLSEGAATMCFS